MSSKPPTQDEAARLELLSSLGILDTPPEDSFDCLARLAARHLGMPFAAISLVDADRVWLKARIGLDGHELPRDHSFCAACVSNASVLVVPDAAADPRFARGVLVNGMGIRFYAGAPILAGEGRPIGTLCVLDTQPRSIGEDGLEVLRDLAAIAGEQIGLRHAHLRSERLRDELEASNGQRTLLAHVASRTGDAVVITDAAGRIEWVNDGFTRITGYQPDEVIGRTPGSVLQGPSTDPATVAHMGERVRRGEGFSVEILNYAKCGRPYWLAAEVQPVRDDAGAITNFVAIERDITAQRRGEDLLRQHKLVIENSGIVCFRWRVSDEWPVELVSENVDQFGFTARELLDGTVRFEDIVFPEDRARILNEVQESIRNGIDHFKQEYRILCRDGRVRWVLDHAVVERDEAGRAVVLQGVVIDIDERRRAQDAVQTAEEKLRHITAQVPGAVYQFRLRPDGSTEIPYMSDGVREICDVTPEQLYSDPTLIRARVPEEDLAAFDASIQESARTMERWNHEFRVRRADGTVSWMGGSSTPQREADGSVLWHGFMVDLTRQKQVEHEYRHTSAMLERTNSIAHVGGWEFTPRTNELHWSPEVYRIHEVELGTPVCVEDAVRFYREDVRATISAAVRDGLEHGKPWDLELPLVTAKGREIWVRAQGEPVRVQGEIVAVCGAFYDMTEQHRAREELASRARELERLRDAAEAANRSKSEFLANMSHEIRTPLTAILGYTELMRDDEAQASSPEWRRRTSDTILTAGRHLMTVINDVLDISKIEAGKLTVERIETPLAEIIEETVSLMRIRASEKGIDLGVRLTGPVPDRILLDPTRLRQILMNLIGNAVKFTTEGSVTLAVGPRADKDGQRLVIDVEDTGPGIPAEQTERLFSMFSQADQSLTRRHGGTGLGLVISRRLAMLMGGDVSLTRTEVGDGACFRIDLPLEPAPGALPRSRIGNDRPADRPGTNPDAPPADHPLSGRILLAEDGPDNQRLISHHLRRAGAEVAIAENGREALAMMQDAEQQGRPFDLLVTDIQMPGLDGYALARALRRGGSRIAIVALTAHAMPEDRQRCLDAGCDDYASKPIERAALLRACGTWIGRASPALDRAA